MKVPASISNFIKCLCIKCPSHNKCMKLKIQKIFCSKGKSSCKVEKTGCICPKCQVAIKYSLKKLYYCIIGVDE